VSDSELRDSPLHDLHVAAGAAFTDFAGWRMPVRYGSDLAEHAAVRTAAGLFDLSHMAEFEVAGPDAARFLDAALTLDASALALTRAKYALLLAEDGGVLDDLVVYATAPGRFLVVANAANHDVVAAALDERVRGFDATVTDATDATALVAVQGPDARRLVAGLPELQHRDEWALGQTLESLPYYACFGMAVGEHHVLVARTGYTGEDGFELFADADTARRLWTALVAAGATPAGLAARDTLRLEAGMPLYGHELARDVLPQQAGLARALPLGTKRADFVGRAAVEAGPAPDARVLVGLRAEGRRAARAGYPVLRNGVPVGEVTSGALSPTLGHPIAMAFVDPASAGIGTALDLDVRGSAIPATVVPLPFHSRKRATS
jgi:aminomethyltransferase